MSCKRLPGIAGVLRKLWMWPKRTSELGRKTKATAAKLRGQTEAGCAEALRIGSD